MDYYSPQNPDYGLWYTFRRAHEAIHKIRKLELRRFKLSTVETGVLLIVHEGHNRVTPAEISRQLLKDPHSISQLLVRMAKKGLLKNIKGVPKKNMVQVQLTPKGEEAYKLSTKGNKLNKIMCVLSEKEKKQLISYLDRLRERAIEEIR